MSKSHLFIFLAIFMLFFASGCATIPPSPGLDTQEVNLSELSRKNGVISQWDSISHIVTILSNENEAKALVGSPIVLIGEEKIILSSPVRIEDSLVMVPGDFQKRVINRIKKRPRGSYKTIRFPSKRIREIIIDAGHGGKDPGVIGKTGLYEKRVVLDIAKRLKKILKKKGFKVSMTRDRDRFITLKKRTEIASQSKADFFISIHANASFARGASGVEVFSVKELGYWDKNEAQRKTNQKVMFENLSMKQDVSVLDKIVADMLYIVKRSESDDLASSIAYETSRLVKTKNRGLKHSRFYVLRNTLIPAVLVEVGFLSNPKEEKLLKTSSYRQRIAQGIANGIIKHDKAH